MNSRRRSLDHLVGAHQQQGRHFDAERLGDLEIDHQLELGRLEDRKVCWPSTFENTPGVTT